MIRDLKSVKYNLATLYKESSDLSQEMKGNNKHIKKTHVMFRELITIVNQLASVVEKGHKDDDKN